MKRPCFYTAWCLVTGLLESHITVGYTTTVHGRNNIKAYDKGRRIGRWLQRKS